MAQDKINSRDEGIRYRMRKYDTYIPRAGSSRIRNAESAVKNPIILQENIISAKAPQNQNSLQINTKQHLLSHQVRTARLSAAPASTIALRAVNNARLAQDDIFPDQLNTVYGSTKRKLSRLQKFMYGFGVLVLVFSLFVSIQSFINNKNAKDQIATLGANSSKDEQGVSQGTGNEPSEEEVSYQSILAYQVSNPEDPRYLRIPELKVFARIKNLGIDNKGAVDSPHNIYDAGWYNGSARPGSRVGSSLILGHVSGWTAPGVFKNLKKLTAGVQFEIEKGSGEKIKYEVTRIENIPVDQVDMSKVLSTEIAGEHDVKLMTCGGKYDKNTKSFTERTILYAREIK